jgi:hypothetical protein
LSKWLGRDNSFSIIAGESNQSFTAFINGNYATEITENGCIDTTFVQLLLRVGLGNTFSDLFIVYPNRIFGNLKFDFEVIYNNIVVRVFNSFGRVVINEHFDSIDKINLNIEGKSDM